MGLEGTIFPWTEQLTSAQRKSREHQQLLACGGGKLGITGLVEVEMLCTQIDKMKTQWLAMTGRSATPIVQGGIEVNFQAGTMKKINSIVMGVRSLTTARKVLAEAGLLGACLGNEVSMPSNALTGLDFRFRQI